ncbi:hypothetical protein HYDPIDRAFT_168239 [Hydnomerulius pinastri MD-312]|uniref:MYND-type domain-containing protein n=1 Tax=Hydnomerulius pinastri MD-312 TaxID=994086 RepID=A0A0C9WEA9_9AGAM|nr:hypothetical protein HYDPIDRAFT_168239 [Hydnomerulius pinastri MD-312]
MLAKWSLSGIVAFYSSTLGSPLPLLDSIITDAMMSHWNQLFPWLSFLIYKVIMKPAPAAGTLEGYSLTKMETLRLVGELFGALCQYSASARQLVRSTPEVRRTLMQLWTVSVDTHFLHGSAPWDEGAMDIMRTTIAAAVIEILSGTDISPFIEDAGGVTPFVLTALKLIRMTTAALKKLPTSPSSLRRADQSPYLVMLAGGISHTARLLIVSSHDNVEIRQAFLDGGSIPTVIDALGQLQARLLLPLGDNIDRRPQRGLPLKRQMLNFGYGYLLLLLEESEDAPALVGEMINARILDTIVTTMTPRYDTEPDEGDINFLRILPQFLMYRSVLTAMNQSIRRIVGRGIRVRDSPDVKLRKEWSHVETVVTRYSRLEEQEDLDPFYDYSCGSPFCTRDDDPPLYRCKACRVICYCSKKCQRADWRASHRSSCEAFGATVGLYGTRALRKSLPLIAAIEREEWKIHEISLMQLVIRAKMNFPNCRDRLVVELDLVCPLDEYMVNFPNNPIWQKFFISIEAAERRGQHGFIITVAKIPQQFHKITTILSPDHALKIHRKALGID